MVMEGKQCRQAGLFSREPGAAVRKCVLSNKVEKSGIQQPVITQQKKSRRHRLVIDRQGCRVRSYLTRCLRGGSFHKPTMHVCSRICALDGSPVHDMRLEGPVVRESADHGRVCLTYPAFDVRLA